MSTQKIQVFVRCRPLNEKENGFSVEVLPDNNEVRVLDRHNSSINNHDTKNFYFDRVFDPQARQADVYKTVVRPLIDQVLFGFNCTVFAYGQTGTGKTYTMEGHRSDENLSWEEDPHCGIIPRATSQLFEELQNQKRKFTVRVSFLELYNEDAYDLLSSIEDATKLRIYDDVHRKGSVIVGGLKEVVVNSKEEIFEILERGSAKRQKAATMLNACSSRSHTIFSITVHIREEGSMQGEELLKVGKLNLVDLAGSENIRRSGAQDIRAREAGSINQALLTLGRVITALVENRPHIPYRESKLTRLLQDSLGGKTKTSLIATISPSPLDYEDTVNVLDYASRAKNITNNPEVNQRTTKLSNESSEIDRLRKELESIQDRHSNEISEIEFKVRNEVAVEFKREMERMKQSYKDTYEGHMKDIIRNRDEIFTQLRDTESELDNAKVELQAATAELQEVKSQLEATKVEVQEAKDEAQNATKQAQTARHELEIARGEAQAARDQAEIAKKEAKIARDEVQMARNDAQEAKAELQKKDALISSLRDQVSELMEVEQVNTKKANRVRCKIPEDVDEYANLTFDNDDEIALPSAKKQRKKVVNAGKKREINQAITLSGKKKKITNTDVDIEVSPVPTRVTRSRATKRKLDF